MPFTSNYQVLLNRLLYYIKYTGKRIYHNSPKRYRNRRSVSAATLTNTDGSLASLLIQERDCILDSELPAWMTIWWPFRNCPVARSKVNEWIMPCTQQVPVEVTYYFVKASFLWKILMNVYETELSFWMSILMYTVPCRHRPTTPSQMNRMPCSKLLLIA